jgi:hypothetical protein
MFRRARLPNSPSENGVRSARPSFIIDQLVLGFIIPDLALA